MPDTPEIERLTDVALRPDDVWVRTLTPNYKIVPLDAAIQAVRDTEARVRREAFREAVEALRERTDRHDEAGVYAVARALREAADFFESRFLSHPDNQEGNA